MTPSDPPTSTSEPKPSRTARGIFAWIAKNSVAANLLLGAMLLGGMLMFSRIKQEVFPEFSLDIVTINVVYPGASPEEVERGVTLAIEEGIRTVDGVKQVTSTSREGRANVMVELQLNANSDRALNDIKSAVDRITSFPVDIEEPTVSLVAMRNQVISLVVYGDVAEKTLRELSERTRDELLQDQRISYIELASVRPLEIGIEVPRERLREYNLTLEQVAQAVRAANVEIPAGGIKSDTGEILLRTTERRDFGEEFGNIVLRSRADGSSVTLRDVATIKDSFAETDQEAYFNGKRAAMVRVYRVGEEKPIDVADAVHEFIGKSEKDLPPGVHYAVWDDRSQMFRQRIDLLMRNALQGLVLVLLSLGLFLEIRLAFWVTMGIPSSIIGSFLLLGSADVSINMISLFAFIVTLGIVVDDAIVVSEAIHKRRGEGMSMFEAAVAGTRDVAVPVIFSVLTTVVAFAPLLFVPGTMGKFFRNIPLVVHIVLLISLAEALIVLPSHLAHENPIARVAKRGLAKVLGERLGPFGWLHRAQQRFSDRFEGFIEHRFQPFARRITHNRYPAAAFGIGMLIVAIGYVAGGRIDFTFMPKIESDVVFAQLTMPYGMPVDGTKEQMQRMVTAAREVLEDAGGIDASAKGIFSQVGEANFGGMGRGAAPAGGSHVAEVAVLMLPVDQRKLSAREMAQRWRQKIGDIPGADSLKFQYTTGASADAPISVRLSHRDVGKLEAAAADLANTLRGYSGVKDIDDGVSLGKTQYNFELKPEARTLGITENDLARQVRSAFYGAEAARQQRGRNEVRVFVRLPKEERSSLYHLEQMLIRAPAGGEIPLHMAAKVTQGRAYTEIQRLDGRRTVTVEADVEEGKANGNKVMEELKKGPLPDLLKNHPRLTWAPGGQQRNQAESLGALATGFLLSLLLNFALIAIPLRSYFQPIIIMTVIPFGLVGALFGHIVMGYDLSMLSMMGLVALSGVVVNDSIVLIDAINEFRRGGMDMLEAAVAASTRRFRPILLTSLTTFCGLAPMIFEKSLQARFLIPMALSLGFGLLFSTIVVLLLVPCFYLILQDVGAFLRRLVGEDESPTTLAGPIAEEGAAE